MADGQVLQLKVRAQDGSELTFKVRRLHRAAQRWGRCGRMETGCRRRRFCQPHVGLAHADTLPPTAAGPEQHTIPEGGPLLR